MQAVRSLRGVAAVVALGALVTVVAATGTRLRQGGRPPDARMVYLPDASALRPLVLGYDNVLADLLWFRTVSYFGEHYRGDREYPWLAHLCDIVTDLDPRAEHVYRFAGLVLPWAAHRVDDALRLLHKGVVNLPESWLLRYHLGMTYYLFLHDAARAAEHLGAAARLPGAPPLVTRLAALLGAQQHGAATTLEFLREMRDQSTSPQVREVLEKSIAEAQTALLLERLDATVATFQARTGRLPASLDELVTAGLLTGVPPDAFGGRWVIDPDTGRVRSSTGRVPLAVYVPPARRAPEGR